MTAHILEFPRLGFTKAITGRRMRVFGFGCAVAVCENFAVVPACRVIHAFLGTNRQLQASNHGDVAVP
jgi:hypothetical protein